jgi:hypothetical protein
MPTRHAEWGHVQDFSQEVRHESGGEPRRLEVNGFLLGIGELS